MYRILCRIGEKGRDGERVVFSNLYDWECSLEEALRLCNRVREDYSRNGHLPEHFPEKVENLHLYGLQ